MRYIALILSLLALVAGPVSAQGGWETAARLDASRAGLGVVVHEGRIYAAGGSGLTDPRDEFESYDLELDRWFPETPLPRGLERFGMASINDRIYVAGGYARGEDGVAPSAGVWSWSFAGNIWQSEAAMPAAKADLALVAFGDALYAFGGLNDDGNAFVFDPEARSWDTLEAPADVTRRGMAAAVIEGRIYLAGGRLDGETVTRFDVFDPETGAWARLPDLPSPRSGAAVAVLDGRIHLLGGRGADARETLQTHVSWQPGDTAWREEAMLPAPRTGGGAAVLDHEIYLIGGGSGGGFLAPFTALDTTDVFDPGRE
ncbi:kelch repeat-containing protein [Maricaulis sp.]|uniref:Kelch repeat-containing protein n=1 Tax=Maricaulis sp. TaxID=1486257 RepID=UPI00260AE46F|nr:kelch repeat-containing protein [Maricaulis sp.]MDF1769540.1 kelch repeat-containing protein [Maricaulis sp.]